MRKLEQYMKYRELPDNLQKQISNHFQSLWQREHGVAMHDILEQLPVPMRLDIAYCVRRDVLRGIKTLSKCRKVVQQTIALAMKPQVCSAGDYVYQAGDIGSDIYFIFYGEVNVFEGGSNSKKVPKGLSSGDYFGERSVLSLSGERTESVQAVTQCELYYINKLPSKILLLTTQAIQEGLHI